MSPQTVLSVTQCLSCGPNSLADKLETGLLQIILGILGAPMTQSEIMAGAACYVCLGLSLPEAIRMVLLNEISANVSGGTTGQDMQVAWTPTNLKLGEMIAFSTPVDMVGITSLVFNGVSGAGFLLTSNSTLQTLSFPNLTSLPGTLSQTGGLFVTDSPAFVSVSAPKLVSCGDPMAFNTCAITTVNFPLLQSVFTLGINTNPIVTLSLPVLATSVGDITLNALALMTSCSLPSLVTVGGSLQIKDALVMTSLTLSALKTVGGDFDVENHPLLVTLSLPEITTVAEGFYCYGNGPGADALVSFSAPKWVPTNGKNISFLNQSLSAASVAHILRRCVLAGVTTCTISLQGGANAGLASLSVQGQADYATLFAAGNAITLNP